jgi:hypothetical protein
MNWEAIAAMVALIVAILGGNAWLMKLVIKSCIDEALLAISKEYATKEDLREHVDLLHK